MQAVVEASRNPAASHDTRLLDMILPWRWGRVSVSRQDDNKHGRGNLETAGQP